MSHDVVFILEVNPQLVPMWDLFVEVMRDDISNHLPQARFEIIPITDTNDATNIALIPISDGARRVHVSIVIDLARQYMLKRAPTKLVTYNQARLKAREPRFIYDNSMYDDPPTGYPKGEYKPSTEPVMGLRV